MFPAFTRTIVLASLNTTGEEDQEGYFSFPLDSKQRKTKNPGKLLPYLFMTQL